MNRVKSTLAALVRSLPLRGEDGRVAPHSIMVLVVVLFALVGIGATAQRNKAQTANGVDGPTHSTTIALTNDETRVVVVNREANSVSIIQVKNANGNDVATKLAEISVGEEPRCVAIHPSDRAAYVTNGISGTVSVIDLVQGRVAATIPGFTEPRGCPLTADGSLLYVANHTAGTVSIVVVPSGNPLNPIPDGAVNVGGRPTAVAITDRGTGNISDDTVFVTQIFAELNPDFKDPVFDGNGENRDLGKRGVLHAFPAGNANPPITKITLKPLPDSGFNANRVTPNNFCNTVPPAQSNIFCPNPDDPTDPININNPQGVFPNQLLSALIRGDRLFLPNIGAQPEPPETASTNVQALVNAVDTQALAEVGAGLQNRNLNKQIAVETAAPPPSLDRTFLNDIVAIDANRAGDTFLIVSRGGNQVIRAKLADAATGALNILNAAKGQSGLPSSDGQSAEWYRRAPGWHTRLRQQRSQFFGYVHEYRGWFLPDAATRYRLVRTTQSWQLRTRRSGGQARFLHCPWHS